MLTSAAPALAAQCETKAGFNAFIGEFKQEAARQGVSRRGLAALEGLTLDPQVIAADRRQYVFKQTFEQFSARMISRDQLVKGAGHMQRYGAMLRRMEQRYGVPAAIVIAVWGLETDYGVNQGKFLLVRSVATIAYDCRRSDKFQGELLDTLRIVVRGDMTVAEMHGQWAGDIGQIQFLPSFYYKYAVDFDGDGCRDLIHSAPDVLASTANYFRAHDWQPGHGWEPGQPNFEVIKEWNKADVYAGTIALFADKLAGGVPRTESALPQQNPQRLARRARP